MNTIITEPRTNNYRNMSVVTIVPFRCGTFKYHEMVLCDKNPIVIL